MTGKVVEGEDVHRVCGGIHIDYKGNVIEELVDACELVRLKDGRGTRCNILNGTESVLDLTLVSNVLGGIKTIDHQNRQYCRKWTFSCFQ